MRLPLCVDALPSLGERFFFSCAANSWKRRIETVLTNLLDRHVSYFILVVVPMV